MTSKDVEATPLHGLEVAGSLMGVVDTEEPRLVPGLHAEARGHDRCQRCGPDVGAVQPDTGPTLRPCCRPHSLALDRRHLGLCRASRATDGL